MSLLRFALRQHSYLRFVHIRLHKVCKSPLRCFLICVINNHPSDCLTSAVAKRESETFWLSMERFKITRDHTVYCITRISSEVIPFLRYPCVDGRRLCAILICRISCRSCRRILLLVRVTWFVDWSMLLVIQKCLLTLSSDLLSKTLCSLCTSTASGTHRSRCLGITVLLLLQTFGQQLLIIAL